METPKTPTFGRSVEDLKGLRFFLFFFRGEGGVSFREERGKRRRKARRKGKWEGGREGGRREGRKVK